ncbi:hypothetical protein Tco_1182903 [Tanacetum coccineum]
MFPLALVAHTGLSSRNTSSYYVTHPSSVVDYDEEFEQDDVHNHSESPSICLCCTCSKAMTQTSPFQQIIIFRACLNTRNQAVVQEAKIEMYKERNQVLENITKDNNYLKEFLEADERAKRVQKQAESQLERIREIITISENNRDEVESRGRVYIEIPLNVRDSEETLEEAFKSQQKMNAKMNNPIAVANKQNCWTIDYKQLNALYNDFVPQKESFVEQTCPSSPYTPFVKILETKTMPNQVKPLLNELQDHFDSFQNLFQRDIKEMKDAFEQNDVYLDEIERQNDLLKDQLLEVSLKHDIELCVLLNHECVDKYDATSGVKSPKSSDSMSRQCLRLSLENEAKKEAVYVVQIVLWIVDSGCSKHMTGDRSLLRNFVEKFMGTVRFGNDNFAAITGYGDYTHGNITICHVYYVEGLGHNLFSVGQFCDGDLEVAFSF